MNTSDSDFERAADAIMQADALIVAAGAGMGVDSGLPDFRGEKGFWGAYPSLGRAKIPFERIANPAAFRDNAQRAWGFYGHRLKMYREIVPGPSFDILKSMAERLPFGAFAYTSNVDGHFQRAGFPADRVWERHGSIHFLQCLQVCKRVYWSAEDFLPDIDVSRSLILNAPPVCPYCGAIARPNIYMFGDWAWVNEREQLQRLRYDSWRATVRSPVVIEIGAGTAIPTVRRFSDQQKDRFVIRINPDDPDLNGTKGVGLAMSGYEALKNISAVLNTRGWLR